MWSGALASTEHCPYCQCTAVAQAGKTLRTFKGYLSWEKVNFHSHNLPAAQRNIQTPNDGPVTQSTKLYILHVQTDLGSIEQWIKKQNP